MRRKFGHIQFITQQSFGLARPKVWDRKSYRTVQLNKKWPACIESCRHEIKQLHLLLHVNAERFCFLKAADEVYEEQLNCWNRLVTNIGFSVVRTPVIRIPGRSEEIWFKCGSVIYIQVRITSHYYYYCCCYYYCILLCIVFPL